MRLLGRLRVQWQVHKPIAAVYKWIEVDADKHGV